MSIARAHVVGARTGMGARDAQLSIDNIVAIAVRQADPVSRDVAGNGVKGHQDLQLLMPIYG